MTERKGFNSILEDNEEHYYQLLDATINSVDEYSNTLITKKPSSISVRISPSEPIYSQPLLKEILSLHNLLKIKLNLSKSMKNSSIIHFDLPIV